MALVSFLSGGYNLHRYSDAIGLVLVVPNVNGDKICVNKLNDLPSVLRNFYQNVCQKLACI